MRAQQLLKNFLAQHPDYWNFRDEIKEVEKLIKACELERTNSKGCLAVMQNSQSCPNS